MTPQMSTEKGIAWFEVDILPVQMTGANVDWKHDNKVSMPGQDTTTSFEVLTIGLNNV